MPWVAQYLDWSQSARCLVPLLALHPMQHRAMFSRVTMLASLTMCSHDGRSAPTRNLFGEFDSTLNTATVAFNDLALNPVRNLPPVHGASWCWYPKMCPANRERFYLLGGPDSVKLSSTCSMCIVAVSFL